MGWEESDIGHRADDGPPGTPGSVVAEYRPLSDDRLIECYRRNSKLLRRSGTDYRTIKILCAVEECLRARDIDPDEVIEGLYP